MSRRVRIGVECGDIARVGADVIAVKYAGALSGAGAQIAAALGVENEDLKRAMPSPGCAYIVPSWGCIAARDVIFVRASEIGSFSLNDARAFMVYVLDELRTRLPATRHVAFTLYGHGFEMDYERATAKAVGGLQSAILAGNSPRNLERITIVDRAAGRAELQSALDNVLPKGFIEAPGSDPPPHLERVSGAAFDVFISFKSEDADHAQRVFDLLEDAGLRVFFSRETLPRMGSAEYHREIDAAIDRARHMVVVASSAAHANAKWVEYEWRAFLNEMLAGRKAGNLITVLAGGMAIEDLPLGLRNREAVRLTPSELPRLLAYTRTDADRFEPAVPPPPPPRSSPVRSLGRLLVASDEPVMGTSWNDARRHAASLTIDGHLGWRLPTLDELRLIREASLVPARFCYWSAEEAGKSEAFYMHFDDGHVGRGPRSYASGLSAVFVKDSC